MTYEEAQNTILKYSSHRSCLGLKRMQQLNTLAGEPDNSLKFIHVAGTNGKGSTSVMIAQILKEAGYKVGLFTSPSLQEFNERLQINGTTISDNELFTISKTLEPLLKKMEELPTEYELTVEIAFNYFKNNNCDIVILEVGLGGRFDATNIIKAPELAIITAINFDHTELLGNTLRAITLEKCGIIKPNSNVLLFEQEDEICNTVAEVCKQRGASLTIADFNQIHIKSQTLKGQTLDINELHNIFLPLLGNHQSKNACMAINSVKLLNKQQLNISNNAIYTGLKNAFIPARFEIINQNPLVILDGGHNPQCFDVLIDTLNEYFNKKIVFIIGVLKDKDYELMIKKIVPIAKFCYTVAPNSQRALQADELSKLLTSLNVQNISCESVDQALNLALRNTKDILCCAGSLYLAGDIRNYFKLKAGQKLI